jgi:hypothetical protein
MGKYQHKMAQQFNNDNDHNTIVVTKLIIKIIIKIPTVAVTLSPPTLIREQHQ